MKTSEFQNLQLVKIDLHWLSLLLRDLVLELLRIIGLSSSNYKRLENKYSMYLQSLTTNQNQYLINKR